MKFLLAIIVAVMVKIILRDDWRLKEWLEAIALSAIAAILILAAFAA